MEFESKEYLDYVTNGISGNLTRGLVVSTEDTLYAGRVKVWIPCLHGGFYSGPPDLTADVEISLITQNKGTDNLGQLTDQGIECLPWASVMGHNWGPTTNANSEGQYTSDKSTNTYGVFNIPAVGTEVFLIFEDNDPNLPVIIGTVFHESELLQNTRIKSLEISPGIPISTTLSDAEEQSQYPDRVAKSYLIQSENGSQLCLSDITGQEQIVLGGHTNLQTQPVIMDDGDPSSKYSRFSSEYPNFPTTASAPYRDRSSINTGSSIINVSILQTTPGAIVPSVNIDQANSLAGIVPTTPTVAQANGEVLTITKRAPVSIKWDPVIPGTYRDFGYDRTYEVHQGIDLSVKQADLIAPIDCIILAYQVSSSAGTYLIIKGVDGYCQAFLHLQSILPAIIQDVNAGTYKKYAVGTKLGITGNTGHVEGTGGGWHLHWEVFKGDGVINSQTAFALREKIRKQSPHGTVGFVHPLSYWLKSDAITDANGNPATTEIILPASQIQSYSAVFNTSTDPKYDKIIGLEMSLTPGAEHIFIRHPSGGYAGFDADGNWKVFTPGNAEYRVNRNMVFDVLGGFMTSCLSTYIKAKTVINLISPIGTKILTSLTTLPKVFTRIDDSRQKDMNDALTSSSSNVYYNLTDSALGKPLSQVSIDGFAYSFTPSDRNYSDTTYDALIRTYHDKYIPKTHVLYSLLTPSLIKSVALQESNYIASVVNHGGYVGLFQLGSSAIMDITKQNNVVARNYVDPEMNINVGVQYILKCVNIMLACLSKEKQNSLSADEKQSILGAALLGYNAGPYSVAGLYKLVITQNNTLDYCSLEERFVGFTNKAKEVEALNYYPNILYILGHVHI